MTVLRDPEQAETRLLHALIDFADKDVLEVGAGDGRLTWRYAAATRSVLALDPVADCIAQARADAPPELRPKLNFQVGDITTTRLPAAAFDLAILSWSLC
jgi:ubiquinone/menaquinone biosynthesis C-methylase UbiE